MDKQGLKTLAVKIGEAVEKAAMLQQILGMTGSPEGAARLAEFPEALNSLVVLSHDDGTHVARNALQALVNVSAEAAGADRLLGLAVRSENPLRPVPACLLAAALDLVLREDSPAADVAAMLLSNLTRSRVGAERLLGLDKVTQLVGAFSNLEHNRLGRPLHHLGAVLCNLAQAPAGRSALSGHASSILPFCGFAGSSVRRSGAVGCARNLCFDRGIASKLLADGGLLVALLEPLAGPEDLPDDEMEQLPVELQYLGPEKRREPQADIRRMLLEALTQVCATRPSREVLRKAGAYFVLREMHRAEQEEAVRAACEDLVDLLIRTEDEIGADDLDLVDIPPEFL